MARVDIRDVANPQFGIVVGAQGLGGHQRAKVRAADPDIDHVLEAPPGGAQSETSQVVDGYAIYPGFVKLISSLHGIDGVGKPLSNPRYNYAQQRVEQYFENAAFYYRFDDPSGKVNMLPYGWYYCGRTCHYEVSEDNRAFNPVIQPLDTPFAPALENIGGLRVFGQPLTQPYKASDGNIEQVYENIVVYSAIEHPDVIHLRPLARRLDMIVADPGPKKYGPKDNMVFYPTTGQGRPDQR